MKFPSEASLFERPFLLVLCALLVGGVLRFMVAANVGTLADEMLHGPHAMNILSSGVINVQNQSPAWFYLTDLFYMLFGVGALSARSLSLLYGLLMIPLIYLLGVRLASRRVGILASMILAFSAYSARYSLMEMDLAFSFFIFLSLYLFIPHFTEHRPLSLPFFISLGVAVLLKPIALPFIAGFGMILFFKGGCILPGPMFFHKKKPSCLER